MVKTFLLGIFLFLLSLLACTPSDSSLSSPEFDLAMEDLNHYRAERYLDVFPRKLDSTFKAVKNKRPLDYYHYYEFWAWIKWVQDDIPSALKYTDSMLTLLTPLPQVEREYAHSLVQKGILLRELNLYSEALREFYAANSFAERFIKGCGASEVYTSLGSVLFEQQSYEEALYYYQKSAQAAMECDSLDFHDYFIDIQNSYNAIGLCFERLGNYDSARIFYDKGLEFIDKHVPQFPNDSIFMFSARGVFYGNYGNTELLDGNVIKAEELFKKSIQINGQKGFEVTDAIYTHIKLGKCFLVAKKLDSIPQLMDSVRQLLVHYPNAEAQKRLHEFEVHYYVELGDSTNAFRARENQLAIIDSVSRLKKELPSINIPASFTYFSQKEELANLHTSNQRNFLLLLSALTLVVLLSITMYLIRKNLLTSKKHASELTEVNEELHAKMDQLNQTMADLESSQEENTHIMKIIAHDLRSPVSSINSMAQVLLANENLDKEQKEGVNMILKISKDSLVFFEDLLNMHGSMQDEEKVNTDLLELIDYCVNFMQLRANEKNQRLSVTGNHVFLPIYRERVWRVINNLLSNAIKFSPMGGEIALNLTESETHIRLEVRDQGIGIPTKMKNQIFNMMGEAKRPGTAGEKSFGLGLAISLQIMEAHKGRIWFESEESVGASFFIEFPRG